MIRRDALVSIPYLLTFGQSDAQGRATLIPGRGEAGWTVALVKAENVVTFLKSLPACAYMPGTSRIAERFGL